MKAESMLDTSHDVELAIWFKMTMGQWIKIRAQMPDTYPAGWMAHVIDEAVGEATRTRISTIRPEDQP